jgi:hypothetical protein
VARFLFCCYRAKHQAITIDEASTYLAYLDGPWQLLGSQYSANNHVLFTILAKLSISVLGLSEFTFRLPSLVAGFFLTVGIFKMLRPVRSGVLRWAAFAAICLHPLLLDFSILARGYGLAVALLMWAICFVMDGRPLAAGVLLGLATAANLSVAFPAIALIAATAFHKGNHWARVAGKMTLPSLLVFCSICAIPMRSIQRSHFYLGSSDLSNTLFAIVQSSISVGVSAGLFGTIEGARWVARYGLPILAVILVLGTLRRWAHVAPPPGLRLAFPYNHVRNARNRGSRGPFGPPVVQLTISE